MTTYSWKNAVSGDWSATTGWSPAGPVDATTADAVIAIAGAYTVSIAAAENFLVDSLTFAPTTGGVLALDGKLTLGGALAVLTEGSGTINLAGTIAGGTLTMNGGVLNDAGAGVITSAIDLNGGTLAIATGQNLTLSGAVTWAGGDVAGPGTLTTTGTTTISAWAYIDGGLTWVNTGKVIDKYYLSVDNYLTTSTLTNTVDNQVTGIFDITADGFYNFYNLWKSAPTIFNNAGLLEKTAGTGTINFYATVNNSGSVTASAGILELDGGGTLGGSIGATGAGEIAFGGGSFGLGGASRTIANTVGLLGGTVAIATGQDLTLPGAVTWAGGDVDGPGTLTTTGTTTISGSSYIDGGLTWINTGTVIDKYYLSDDDYLTTSTLTNTVDNQATGIFDITADGFYNFYNLWKSAPTIFNNAGLLEKTAGTGTINFYATVNNSGSVTASAGILELDGGGTLGGSIGATGAGEIAFGGGSFGLGATSRTIANAVGLVGGTVAIASGLTLTLPGAVTWAGGDVAGPGTLTTTGTTTISAWAYIDGGLTWVNTGTLIDKYYISDDDYLTTSTLTNTVDNQATGIFDITADGFYNFYNLWHSAPTVFNNAGLLEKTAGTGTVNFYATVNNTGTIKVTSGTLELDGGGNIGGVVSTSGGGVLTFVGGGFTMSDVVENNGTLALAGQTVTFAGASTWGGGDVVGPGTVANTGTATVSTTAYFDGGVTWNNSGTLLDGSAIYDGFYSATALSFSFFNQSLGIFDFTADGFYAFYEYHSAVTTFTNIGLLEKTAGTGIVTFEAVLHNTGTVTATSGTLLLADGGNVSGSIGGTGGGIVEFGGGSFITTGTVIILDASTSNDFFLIVGASFTDSFIINDGGHFVLGNATGTSTLTISAGASFNFTTDDGDIVYGGANLFSNAGTIAKTGGSGTSTISVAFTNTGLLEVASGTLKLTGSVGGTGRFQIDAGKTLELANGGIAGGNTVDLNGADATLRIDTNSSITNSIIGLGAGSRIYLAAATSVTAVINGSTLVITPAGGTALDFVSTTSLAGLSISKGSDGGTGTMVSLSSGGGGFNQAVASVHTPEPVAFGHMHVGTTATRALSITNTAPAGANTEKLDATLTSSVTGFTASGSFTGLGGGATDSTHLTVALNTTSTGTITGTGTLTLASDGAGVDASGITPLPTQTVDVSGAVYALAAPVFSSTTIALGAIRVGGAALTGAVTLRDGSTANAYQESLVYAFNGGTPGTIIAGQTISVDITLGTGTSGNFNGSSITTAFTSTGVGTSGLADTTLTAPTLTVNGEVFAAAVASLSTKIVNFGVVHVGQVVAAVADGVTNTASGALTELLTAGSNSRTGSYTGTVTDQLGSGLAAAASGSVTFGLTTTSSGVQSGTVDLGFHSHDSVLTDLALAAIPVTVTGTVDNLAIAKLEVTSGPTLTGAAGAYALDLGSVSQGGAALTATLGIVNGAAGLADLLGGSFAISGSSSFTNTGFTSGFAGLGAGQDEHTQVVKLAGTTAGVFSETVTAQAIGSNSSGYSGALTDQTITITGTIAAAGKIYTLTPVPVTITGGTGNDTFIAGNATLNSLDQLDGGGGANTLKLNGAGSFDLGAPSKLANIQVVQAFEGQAAMATAPDTRQTVYLRNGVAQAVTVASGTAAAGNTNPETITIYGGNTDTIKLGGGRDTVVLAGTGEVVTALAGGHALVQATAALAGARVNGAATGTTTLEITDGGTATMNINTAHVTVTLDAATTLTMSKAAFVTALGSTGADVITAGAAGQVLTGGAGADTLTGFSGFGDTFNDSSAGLNGDLIKLFGGSDQIDLTDTAFSSLQPLAFLGGVLSVANGTHTSKINFAGSYALANFHAATDNHTGTLISFVP